MELSYINEILMRRGVMYIEDDIEEIAVRLSYDDGNLQVYAKRRGGREKKTETKVEVVYNALIQGKSISKKRYEQY